MNYTSVREWQRLKKELYFKSKAWDQKHAPKPPPPPRPPRKPGARDSEARNEAGRIVIQIQEGRCAMCARPISFEYREGDCSGYRVEKSSPTYIVHRIVPGRVGGEYEADNVLVVCSQKCHDQAEALTRQLFPLNMFNPDGSLNPDAWGPEPKLAPGECPF